MIREYTDVSIRIQMQLLWLVFVHVYYVFDFPNNNYNKNHTDADRKRNRMELYVEDAWQRDSKTVDISLPSYWRHYTARCVSVSFHVVYWELSIYSVIGLA